MHFLCNNEENIRSAYEFVEVQLYLAYVPFCILRDFIWNFDPIWCLSSLVLLVFTVLCSILQFSDLSSSASFLLGVLLFQVPLILCLLFELIRKTSKIHTEITRNLILITLHFLFIVQFPFKIFFGGLIS